LFDGILPSAAENLFGHASLLNALDLRLRAAEIVIVGRETEALVRAALALPFLDRIVLRAPSADGLPADHPARAKVTAAPTASAAFVCVGETCSLPVTAPDGLAGAIASVRHS
jgi:uncharacterized protein